MTEEQQRAVQMLIDGLAHFDGYGPAPSDDTEVYAFTSNTLYEFANDEDCLRVGHLRQLASIFTQES